MKQGIITLADNDCLVQNSVLSRPVMQSKLILYFLIYYISLPYIEAPLRYFLVEHDVPWLIYFRDVSVVLIVFWLILKTLIRSDDNKILIILLSILVLHSLIGLIYLPNAYMVLFGWKTFLPILVGVGSYYVFIENLNKMRWLFLLLFVILVSGLFINLFIEFPWEGFTYSLDTYTIEATKKEDTAFGVRRLAGFSRYFYEAAIQTLFLLIFLVVYTKNNIMKIIIWVLGGLAIILTTVKGVILSYLLITILLILLKINPKLIEYYKLYRKLLLSLLIIVILLPILTYINLLVIDFGLHKDINDMLFSSFTMRLYDTWPEAIELIRDQGNLLLGRGLGGIGQSQIFFETYLYTSVDNIFIFLYGNFGLMGGLYLLYLYYKGRSLEITEELYFCLFLFFIFQYGITQSLFDDYLICLVLGFFLSHVNDSAIRKEYQIQLAKMTQ
jgi:hypothetical protein